MSDPTQPAPTPPVRAGAMDALMRATRPNGQPAKAPRRAYARQRAPGKDRWGLDLPERGWYRGEIQNVERSTEITPTGELITYEFDLYPDDEKAPVLQLSMTGSTFSHRIREQVLVEAYFGAKMPAGRLAVDRLRLPHDPNNDVRAHRPVEKRLRESQTPAWRRALLVLAPGALVIGFVAIAHFIVGAF